MVEQQKEKEKQDKDKDKQEMGVDSAGKGDAWHAWATLDHAFSDALRVSTTLATSRVRYTRDSAGD